jgi:adenylate cyclase
MAFAKDLSFLQGVAAYLSNELFKIDLLFSVFVGFVINFILQVNKFFGPGVFFKLLSGKYHTPREEERIFMFVDIKGSTGLAEKLGDLKFSLLLQDFFYDVNQAIAVSHGEIYQYVGDEVVVSWPLSKVNFENNCLECFYMMENLIWNKRNHYLKNYQVVPEFKAGIHYGKVIAAWVGDFKKEIVYHGDVMNTTARILSQCNELEQNLLVSEELYQKMQLPEDVKTSLYTDILLKGKREPVNLVGFTV